MFKRENGDWTRFRSLGNYKEIDFHFGSDDYDENGNWIGLTFWDKMDIVYDTVMESLKEAQEEGIEYLIFTHGYSTSRPGQTTARSVVRGIMRSKASTPYIIKNKSIQHYSVFVAAIRPKRR